MKLSAWIGIAFAMLLVACGGDSETNDKPAKTGAAQDFSQTFLLDTEPADFVHVKKTIDSVNTGDDVVVFGRMQDSVKGLGAFLLIDRAIPSCDETGCECPTPWDFC